MLFPTLSFAAFFAVVLPVSWLLMPHRVRWRLFMIGASWFFYGAADWRFVPLLAGSTVVNHFFARRIHSAREDNARGNSVREDSVREDNASGPARRNWTVVAVTANLAVLGWFKYIGFLSLSLQSGLRFVGIHAHVPLPEVLLPVGISFFTFQALSYVIDTSRGKVEPVALLDFAVYLSFFPHLIAGPIVRATEFLPQIKEKISPRNVDIGKAFWLISLGLFKKVVIASYLGTYAADPLFGFPRQHSGIEALFGVYAYAIQIYMDFSGYTDIAIGLALLLGINFPQNFNCPYAAASLQDFWRRWHMTLSRWLRDYLYIPLGGNRQGRARTYLNIMITMLLGGLWHGAAWTFVAWGALHGVGLVIERWRNERRGQGLGKKGADVVPALAPPLASSPDTPPPRPPKVATVAQDLVTAHGATPVETPRPVAGWAHRPADRAGRPPGVATSEGAKAVGRLSGPPPVAGSAQWPADRAGTGPGVAASPGATAGVAPGRLSGRPPPGVGFRPPMAAPGASGDGFAGVGRPPGSPGEGVAGVGRPPGSPGEGVAGVGRPPGSPGEGVAGVGRPPGALGGGVAGVGRPPGASGDPLAGDGATVSASREPGLSPNARLWIGRLVTFHLVCLAWIFFRATSFHNAVEVMGRIADFGGHHQRFNWKVAAVIVGSLAVQLGPRGLGARLQILYSRRSFVVQALLFAAVLTFIDLVGPSGVAPFIYFRF